MITAEDFARTWVAEHAPRLPELDAEGTVVSAVDWRGNRFHVGGQVIYCIGAGRGQMMAIGEVIKIESTAAERTYYRPPEPGETPHKVNSWNNTAWMCEAIPYDEVRVLVRTLKTSGRWDNKERTRPAWVNPMNITALPVGIP